MFYQWNCNGTNIPGATNTTLVVTNAQPDSAGNYYTLTASNEAGEVQHTVTIIVD